MGSAAPWDRAPALPSMPGCLPWHHGAMCQAIYCAARSCRTWKCFAKPPSPVGGEARAEGSQPKVLPVAPVGATQKLFPKQTNCRQHQPRKERARSLQHTAADEPRFPCMAQHSPISRCPKFQLPRTGTAQRAQTLLGMPQSPIPFHGAQAKGKTPSHYNSSR